jgi:hypothetical protein
MFYYVEESHVFFLVVYSDVACCCFLEMWPTYCRKIC